ncbi:hypothetical protein OFO93_33785, partial [Escherichia coli]|nr:hypothetical protein [Escherichia coli]
NRGNHPDEKKTPKHVTTAFINCCATSAQMPNPYTASVTATIPEIKAAMVVIIESDFSLSAFCSKALGTRVSELTKKIAEAAFI